MPIPKTRCCQRQLCCKDARVDYSSTFKDYDATLDVAVDKKMDFCCCRTLATLSQQFARIETLGCGWTKRGLLNQGVDTKNKAVTAESPNSSRNFAAKVAKMRD